MSKAYSRANIDFITSLMSVFEGFQYKGKHYLAYLQSRERNDEFLMRDNLVKPLFQRLGYDQQKDFSPEESIESGRIDTIIWNGNHHPVIVIETQSSLLKDLSEHRKRLFGYVEEIGARFAVLTDGVRFETWECPGRGRSRYQRIALNFSEVYAKFLKKGLDGFSESEGENLLKLKFLSKSLLFIREEELYEEPDLDVSLPSIFSQLLEDLNRAMEMVKLDVLSQFEAKESQWREYEELTKSHKKTFLTSKYRDALQAMKCYEDWQQASPGANGAGSEPFATETMYILFNRLLLIRLSEDKNIIPRQISNGGIKKWLDFKQFFDFHKANYTELLKSAYDTMNQVYPHLFRMDIFDWYVPDSDLLLRVLFILNHYNFANVDRDVLGKLYERYIDKEERKRLGQFYTPEEVIDYILEAVGYIPDQKIEGKKLLDPACGSGGFLVRAVKNLVERYQRRKVPAEIILDRVCNSIYGFDINPFAAHLAEMNLLFQVIDLINEAKKANLEFHMERFNIFVTNSLKIPKTSEDEGRLFSLTEEPSEYLEEAEVVRQIKLKQGEFKDGFDFVVGNPPYVRVQQIPKEQKDYFTKNYESAKGSFDLYVLFVEVGIKLLRENGRLGFITSNKFLRAEYGKALKKVILGECAINLLIDFGDTGIFQDATNYPCVIILQRTRDRRGEAAVVEAKKEKTRILDHISQCLKAESYTDQYIEMVKVPLQSLTETRWEFKSARVTKLLEKIRNNAGATLKDYGAAHRCLYTGLNKAFIVNKQLIEEYQLEKDLLKPVLRGSDVRRWIIDWKGVYVIYSYQLVNQKLVPVDLSKYPHTKRYLFRFKDKLMNRWYIKQMRDLRQQEERWFELADPRSPSQFESVKIVTPDISTNNNFTLDTEGFYLVNTAYVINIGNQEVDPKYLLGLLNSRVLEYYLHHISPFISGGYYRYITQYLEQLPIRYEVSQQKEIIELVDQMLEINKRLPELERLASDLPRFLRENNISTRELADCAEATLVMKGVLGKPNLKVGEEGTRIYLHRRAYIECKDENLIKYLELYLNSIQDELRSKTSAELHQLIQIPIEVEKVLKKHETLQEEIEKLKENRSQIDRTIDLKVYKLYGLTEKEIRVVEEKE